MIKVSKKFSSLFLAAVFLCTACDENIVPATPPAETSSTITATSQLGAIPFDKGGSHLPYVLGSTSAKYGYYLYRPWNYSNVKNLYPLLIFLHGKGEKGDGTKSLAVLNRVLNTGIPRLIKDKKWNQKNPMLVVSPQYHGNTGNLNNWGGGNPNNIKEFIEYMITHYRVDKSRIYITGLSFGGNGIYDYLTLLDDGSNYIAAAAPVAAYGPWGGVSKCRNTPIWTFVGGNDGINVSTTINFVKKYNAQIPAPRYKAKVSVFKGAGHDVWTRTYTGAGIGTADPAYNPFDQSLFDWMYSYKRPL